MLGERVGRALLVAAADDSGAARGRRKRRATGLAPGATTSVRRRMPACSASTAPGSTSATRSFARPCTRARPRTERRDAHRALAAVLEGRDEARRAWHAAAAAVGYDAAAADALAVVATESRERGAFAAAAAAFERSAALTPDSDQRALAARSCGRRRLACRSHRACSGTRQRRPVGRPDGQRSRRAARGPRPHRPLRRRSGGGVRHAARGGATGRTRGPNARCGASSRRDQGRHPARRVSRIGSGRSSGALST